LDRPPDAGDGAESDGRPHHRRAGRAHDPADLPDQRVSGGAGLAADHADLSGEILLRRSAGTGRLHCGDRRRLQSGARRRRRRAVDRCRRQPVSGLCVDPVSCRGAADPPDRHHPVPSARPARPARGAHGMTATGKYLRIALGVVVIAALLIVPMNFNRYGLFILSQWAVMTIAAMGLNLTLGYAGQVALAQGAFVGIGAYAAAIMTTQGMPLIAALGVAVVLWFAIGWILGYPALRVQHHYLAFVTLAFSTLAFLVFRNEDWLTKGIYGISNIPRPNVLGFATNRPLPFYYFCLCLAWLRCLAQRALL